MIPLEIGYQMLGLILKSEVGRRIWTGDLKKRQICLALRVLKH